MINTSPPAQHQQNFVQTCKSFSFYLDIYKNKFKNLIWTSKFKFSFRGLYTFVYSPGDRFTKVIANRKSKINLTISLCARIRAFH